MDIDVGSFPSVSCNPCTFILSASFSNYVRFACLLVLKYHIFEWPIFLVKINARKIKHQTCANIQQTFFEAGLSPKFENKNIKIRMNLFSPMF